MKRDGRRGVGSDTWRPDDAAETDRQPTGISGSDFEANTAF